MNPFIKKELEKIRADTSSYNDHSEVIHIYKKEPSITLKLNHSYIVRLADYILHEPENFTLSKNWNNGIVPSSEYVKLQVSEIVGEMIKVDCSGYDYYNKIDKNDSYISLWLPVKSVTILEEL